MEGAGRRLWAMSTLIERHATAARTSALPSSVGHDMFWKRRGDDDAGQVRGEEAKG